MRQWMRVLVVSLWKPSVRAVAGGLPREVAFRMLLLGSLVFTCRVCLEKARTVFLFEKPRWRMVWSTQAHRFFPLSPIMPMV